VRFFQSNLFLRILSALVLLPVVLFFLWKGGAWGTALFSLAALLCMLEYLGMAWGKPGIWGWVAALMVAWVPWFCSTSFSLFFTERPLFWLLFLVGVLYIGGWGWHLLVGPREEAVVRMGHLVAAFVSIGLGMAALAALREEGFAWVFMALVLTWANDTLAYFTGRLMGKHKMLPSVSPGKTWEGFAGGMLGSMVAAAIMKFWVLGGVGWWACLALGVAAGIVGPLGDLSESALKRSFGKKDSGRLLPGHGGILDRVDALLLVAPVVWLHVALFPRVA